MQPDAKGEKELRVLLVPPTRRDGEVTAALLARAGLACLICRDLKTLSEEIAAGAGAVLLTEEALAASGIERLLGVLQNQPSWSQLPVVLLMEGGGRATLAAQAIQALGNTTLLERPAPARSVISALEVAVKGRERQYQIRDQFEEIRKAEARARELQQQLAIAVDASELGTFHSETPFDTMIWNERCKAHFWLGPEAEVDSELFYSILHPDDRERVRRAVEACIYGGKLYDIEFRTVSPQGETRWVRATGRTYRNAANEPIRFDGTTQDISERKAVETALRETRERFEAMANSIPQLAWMAKPDGWIFWYNQRWHDYCGTTAEQMDGWGWQAVHDQQELPRVIEKWQHCLAQGEPWEDSFPLRRFDGEFRWHLSRAMPFRDASGNIVFWFGTNTDITEERKRSEERRLLLESERAARVEAERVSRMKDEFLATLSHELRTPLNAIFGWTQILRMDAVDPETLQAGIAVIDRNVRIQTQLIEDLLDMSRIVSGKIRLDVQTVQLPEVLHATLEAVRPAAEAKQIRLEKIIDPLAGPVSGDPGRLQQVFWNLLTNAIKFTPKGGKIQVLAERVDSHVEISVSDSGEGIHPEFLPRLFDRFSQADGSTTRKHGGLGLGLSIVKNLVELHGGTVQAKSAGEGLGATFVVQLPLRAAKTLTEELPHPLGGVSAMPIDREAMNLGGVKVLIVDDEPDARELVQRFLSECGASPALASSAVEAQKVLASFAPDVIISDIGMPEQDGYEFMRAVRDRGYQTPAIALTAFARSEDRIRSIQSGYQMHLPKPVEPAELVAIVASLAGRYQKPLDGDESRAVAGQSRPETG